MNKLIICVCSSLVAWTCVAADPTKPDWPVAPSATAQARTVEVLPKLQLIHQQGSRKLAVIDGKSVTQGQQVGRYTVEKIQNNQVTLRRDNERVVLKLFVSTSR